MELLAYEGAGMTIGPALFRTTVTLNPNDKNANISLSSSDLIATKTTNDASVSVRAMRGIPHTDNGYFEVYVTTDNGGAMSSTFMAIGISTTSLSTASYPGSDTNSWGYYQDTGQKMTNAVFSAYGNTWKTLGDIIGVAFKNGKVWFAKNNVWQNSGDPTAGTGEAFSGITGTIYPTLSLYKGGALPRHMMGFRANVNQFAYSPPSGFRPWES